MRLFRHESFKKKKKCLEKGKKPVMLVQYVVSMSNLLICTFVHPIFIMYPPGTQHNFNRYLFSKMEAVPIVNMTITGK